MSVSPEATPAYKEDLYENYANSFQGGNGKFDSEAADKYLPQLVYYLRNWMPADTSSEIMDLGCGNGRVIYCLDKLGYRNVSGIDLSASQVELASQVSPNVVHGDVLEHLRYTEQSYDLMISFDVIEHMRKDEVLEFLQQCHSRLKPGGRLVLQTPNAASPFFGSVRYGDFTHELAFTPIVLSLLLARAGFSGISAREIVPVPRGYSLKSTLRFCLWQVIRLLIGMVDMVETGGRGAAIYSRVFMISGVK